MTVDLNCLCVVIVIVVAAHGSSAAAFFSALSRSRLSSRAKVLFGSGFVCPVEGEIDRERKRERERQRRAKIAILTREEI